jgi:tetratricopeptide (TPR) repeat protein
MEIIDANWVEGKSDGNLFASVDKLTKMIKQNIGLSQEQISSDFDETIGKITTSSPEAYKSLIEGNRYATTGDQTKAIHFYERSIEIDPEFATSYLALAIANWYIGKYSEYKKNLHKSFELRNHVSQREKYLIEGEFYSLSENTFDLAIKAVTNLLKIYPDDSWGRRELGWLYFAIEEWDKCIEQFSVLIKNKDPSFNPYQMSSLAYRAKGAYEEAIEVLENFVENYPNNTYVYKSIANVFICLGKLENALIEVNKAISFNPNDNIYDRTKGDVFLFKGKLRKAEEEYQKYKKKVLLAPIMFGIRRVASLYLLQGKFQDSYLKAQEGLEYAKKINETGWIRHWMYVLAYLDIKSGYPEKAVQKLTKVCEIINEESDVQYKREALHLKAIAYLESGLINEAQNTTDELTELSQHSMNKNISRLSYHLLGMMEFKKEQPSKAIIHFEKALAQMPFQYQPMYGNNHALYMDPLAFSYYKIGELERAQKMYEKIVALTSGRLHYGDIYAKAFYMLGQIYEQKGWEGKAIENYEKFLELWKDADPGIAEVEEAKRRMAKLQS